MGPPALVRRGELTQTPGAQGDVGDADCVGGVGLRPAPVSSKRARAARADRESDTVEIDNHDRAPALVAAEIISELGIGR